MILVKGLKRYQRSKLEVKKNICLRGRSRVHGFEPGWLADIFFDLQIWPLKSLQPLDQNQCLVPQMKDLLCIFSEIKGQSFWLTFKVCNLGSKQPYFNGAYVVRGWIFNFWACMSRIISLFRLYKNRFFLHYTAL